MNNIGLIRDVIPRLYLSLSLAHLSTYPSMIRRLILTNRAIADPIISAYSRMYSCRYATNDLIVQAFQDQLRAMYPRCDTTVIPRIEPALRFMLVSMRDHKPSPFPSLLSSYQECSTDATLLSVMLRYTEPDGVLNSANDILNVIVETHPINVIQMRDLLEAITSTSTCLPESVFTHLRRGKPLLSH